MKQGNNLVMGIRLKDGLDGIEEILFKFVQGNRSHIIRFPSENASEDRDNADVIDLYWSYADTYKFEAGKTIYLDTLIKMTDTQTTPEVPIKEIVMSPTLFRQIEVGDFYD